MTFFKSLYDKPIRSKPKSEGEKERGNFQKKITYATFHTQATNLGEKLQGKYIK